MSKATFEDSRGREWTIEIDDAAETALLEATGMDLREREGLRLFACNGAAFTQTMLSLCAAQIEALGLHPMSFLADVNPVREDATLAVLAALKPAASHRAAARHGYAPESVHMEGTDNDGGEAIITHPAVKMRGVDESSEIAAAPDDDTIYMTGGRARILPPSAGDDDTIRS